MLARLIPPALLALAIGACADHDPPTAASTTPAAPVAPAFAAPSAAHIPSAAARADEAHLEALARRVALALRDSAFRAYVKTELDGSPFAEHKVQFQRFLRADGGRALGALAAAAGESPDAVAADAAAASSLEMYLPVPAHRAAWNGDAERAGGDQFRSRPRAGPDAVRDAGGLPLGRRRHGNVHRAVPDVRPVCPGL